MNHLKIITIVLVVLFLLMAAMPKVECSATRSIVLHKECTFPDMRNDIIQGNFEKEIRKVHGAELLSKTTRNTDVVVSKPFQKERDWQIDYVADIKVIADKRVMDLTQTVKISKNSALIVVELSKPTSQGLTHLTQTITINPYNETFPNDPITIINFDLNMKLNRRVPFWMKNYAQSQLDLAADELVQKFSQAVYQMRVGRVFKIKMK